MVKNILKGKFSISSSPIFREFLLDYLFLEYYLHRLLLLQIVHLNTRSAGIACLLGVFRHLQSSSTLDILYIATNLEEIVTSIYLPLAVSLIEAGKITLLERHLQSLALTWLQQLGLAEGLEHYIPCHNT